MAVTERETLSEFTIDAAKVLGTAEAARIGEEISM